MERSLFVTDAKKIAEIHARTRPASHAPDDSPATEQEWDDHSLALGSRVGEFEITDIIGKGGFGIVYLAWDHSLDRVVALKEYMPASFASRNNRTQVNPLSERHRDTFQIGLNSFVNEAKLLAQFHNPSLVEVHRFWEANGTAYMVMPYYRGKTLGDTIRSFEGPPSEAWLIELLAPLTEALMELHSVQCYHRDVAPDNILILTDSGSPMLLDFGAARRVIAGQAHALTIILKAGYAPIEQYGDIPDLQQGPWTDVYALASVLYWAVTGKTPPPATGRIVRDTYVPLAECAPAQYSRAFSTAIDKALAVLPEGRTGSIAQLRSDLGLDALAVRAPPTTMRWSDPDATVLRPAPTAAKAAPPAARAATEQVRQATPPPVTQSAPATQARRRLPIAVGGGAAALLIVAAAVWSLYPKNDVPVTPESVSKTAAPLPEAPRAVPPAALQPAPVAAEPVPIQPAAEPVRKAPQVQVLESVVAPPPKPVVKTPRVAKPPRNEGEPVAAKSTKPVPNPECEKILMRMSLGEAGQDLIDRMKTLKCN